MAENKADGSDFNFTIDNSMEMGAGNLDLLDDILGGTEDGTTPIVKTTEKTTTKAPEKITKKKEEEEIDEDKVQLGKKNVDQLLSENDESEETATEEIEENEDSKETNNNPFPSLSKELFKLGVFSTDENESEEEITTPEEFLERFNQEKRKGAINQINHFIGQFGEDYQDAFEAIYVKGVDPREYFTSYNKIQNFSELDLTKENNQVAVIKQCLTDQGFEDEDLDTEIERLRNQGDLENVAKKHHKVLIKKEATRLSQMEIESENKLKQKLAYKQQYATNVNNILQEKLKTKEFDGIPINPQLASEIQNYLLVEKYKDATGETLTEFDKVILSLKKPENHGLKVKLALLLKTMEKDPSLLTIQNSKTSKKAGGLFEELTKGNKITKDNDKKANSKNNAFLGL